MIILFRSYLSFRTSNLADDTELNIPRRHVRKRKTKKPKGRKLFQDSSDDDFISDSDESDHGNENDDDEQPIIHTFKSAAKFQSMKLSQQGKKDKVGSSKSAGISISLKEQL